MIACVAVFGLLLLTGAAIVRPPADVSLWHVGTIAVAWVAALASALGAREQRLAEPTVRAVPPPAAASKSASDVLAHGSAAVVNFARELHATLESDRLRLLIAQRLPALLGVPDVWIVARFGTRQQIVLPADSGVDGLAMIGDVPRQWATYPLKADGQAVGILGAALPPEGFSEQEDRLFKLVTPLVAQALATAHAFEAMREASLVDLLTGCVTRAEGARRLEAEVRRAERSGSAVAVLMLDLDHFKSINDRFGHKTGDAALTAVGETLLTTLRASDVRARWGGEEFLLVLPDSNVERAQRAAENLRHRIANTPVACGDQMVHITASIGVTLSQQGETDVQQLVARADTGLYEAKRRGRNQTSVVLGPGPRPGRSRESTPPAPTATPVEEPHRAISQRREGEWDGGERRDAGRQDRRRMPGPGRRVTDAVLSGPWRDR